ncbi:glycosyl hydrolase family 95 catalytic domain-containing protein [Snuella lapsa]|uniref:Glycosyl hydrolase family 95 N-terminal domain-containing protein n=1 Tax=Snuella lapsa TaxID=870481 RepID=A0ABP6XB50_9FLAO
MGKSLVVLAVSLFIACSKPNKDIQITFSEHDLVSTTLAKSWDEGIPLGNGVIGALVWEKEERLRMSLDNVNLWDLRPMENLNTPDYKFSWVYEQWKNDTYKEVQKKFDVPYDRSPAPSKIPGAGLEFNIEVLGAVDSTRLSIADAICSIDWKNGAKFRAFVHASEHIGWFSFKGVPEGFKPLLIPPAYNVSGESKEESPVTGQDLRRLGYEKGNVEENEHSITYTQKGWGGFIYDVNVAWEQKGDVLEGCWSISTRFPDWKETKDSRILVNEALQRGFNKNLSTHKNWWKNFWSKSAINVPDKVLEKQWYLEQYKFGSAARDGAPPISLQAVWTADNGKLPPWKGDYHHDLNTQLSYWPAYSGNHLDLEKGYLEWLLKYKSTFKKYTKDYFESDGLAVPGVTTLTGEPMGGWIQYAFGPTVSGWLSQHFYLHWRYTMDRSFLENKAYPWIREVAQFFEDISVKSETGLRKLPISASPEIHDNSKEAWFEETTNFDLAAIRWTYEKAAELALELGKEEDAKKWEKVLQEWPYFAIDESEGLMFAPDHPYEESHRHFSHLMAFHPYGLIDYSKDEAHKKIIDNTIGHLVNVGSDYFTGYSFSWLANLQARAFDGKAAAKTLRIFAENFCLPNSFHVNGEQHNRGYSKFKYRPFTLEGNFAFAAAVQEMLIQSHTGIIHVFPAIPDDWADVSFDTLRTEGAFLVSAKKEAGEIVQVSILAEKGGVLKLKNPFGDRNFILDATYTQENGIITIQTQANQKINIIADEA